MLQGKGGTVEVWDSEGMMPRVVFACVTMVDALVDEKAVHADAVVVPSIAVVAMVVVVALVHRERHPPPPPPPPPPLCLATFLVPDAPRGCQVSLAL